MSKKHKSDEARRKREIQDDDIVCPFCGRPSASKEYCTRCYAKFNKEVLSIAHMVSEDTQNDMIGPLPLKWAKRLSWALLGLLIILFVVATELSGSGFMSMGK